MRSRPYEAAVTTIGTGIIGVIIAYVLYYLDDNNIWIDRYITVDHTITELMAVCILIFLLLGVIISGLRSR